jgi:hypothetical protein
MIKTASVKEIKSELVEKTPKELTELCLKLSKFKKENKELLTYLLFESDNEDGYILNVQEEVRLHFSEMNKSTMYFIKKSSRKILRLIKKHIRFSKNKETEAELLIYFCKQIEEWIPHFKRNNVLTGIYDKQLEIATKAINSLHEDLQYDLLREIEILKGEGYLN